MLWQPKVRVGGPLSCFCFFNLIFDFHPIHIGRPAFPFERATGLLQYVISLSIIFIFRYSFHPRKSQMGGNSLQYRYTGSGEFRQLQHIHGSVQSFKQLSRSKYGDETDGICCVY